MALAGAYPNLLSRWRCLKGQIQGAAKRLANATGIFAASLESLIDELERYGTGGTYLRRWQY
jgi:hypothetical protein